MSDAPEAKVIPMAPFRERKRDRAITDMLIQGGRLVELATALHTGRQPRPPHEVDELTLAKFLEDDPI